MSWKQSLQRQAERRAERAAQGLKRYSYDAKGRVLTLEHGVTVVPYEQVRGGWYAVVVAAPEGSAYPRGGYNILVADRDIERAEEIEVQA